MADIKQAAAWLESGRKVRRRAWHPEVRSLVLEDDDMADEEWTEIVPCEPIAPGYTGNWAIGDLTADDWELA